MEIKSSHSFTQDNNSMLSEAFCRETEALSVLMFVARADGKMLKPERTEIARYLISANPDLKITETDLAENLKHIYMADSITSFRKNLKNIALKSDKVRLAKILHAANSIVACKKSSTLAIALLTMISTAFNSASIAGSICEIN